MYLSYLFQLTMANVEITVLNDNDHNPEFEKESYVFSDVWYEENGLVGMVKVRHYIYILIFFGIDGRLSITKIRPTKLRLTLQHQKHLKIAQKRN